MTIKRTYSDANNLLEQTASRVMEQMLDQGDARLEPFDGSDLFNHKLITLTGSEYFVWAEEEPTDGPDLAEPSGGHHHCAVAARPVGVGTIPKVRGQMITNHARACSLLEEALDWIGVVNLNEQEEILAQDLQRRIARLLAEVRE